MPQNSKSSNLKKLSKSCIAKHVLPQIIIEFKDKDRIRDILKEHNDIINENEKFAVRSSAIDEDQELSNAGKYKSYLNIDKISLESTISKTFDQYEHEGLSGDVLVQPYLENIETAGVVFNIDPNTLSDYYIINYSRKKSTTSITEGSESGNLIIVYKKHQRKKLLRTEFNYLRLIEVVEKVQIILGIKYLDIEFAVKSEEIYILQARPIYVPAETPISIDKPLVRLENKIKSISKRHPELLGNSTAFSNMSDWNPAELIGIRPSPLAFSIFKELISNNIWAYERSNLGYRGTKSFPLVLDFIGQPYVDLRVSFNSLTPASISINTASNLIENYFNIIREKPDLHDKIEFEVVLSNYDFNLSTKLQKMNLDPNEKKEIKESLLGHTRGIITGERYGLNSILAKTADLSGKFENLKFSQLDSLSKIYWLIEDAKRFGTLPFAGVARCAFIATSLLNSLVHRGVLTDDYLEKFYQNIGTITKQISFDSMNLSKNEFIKTYGFLRPGTFDSRTLKYEEDFERYFPNFGQTKNQQINDNFLIKDFVQKLDKFKELQAISNSTEQFIDFCIRSIVSRESVKFELSKNISYTLDLINELGIEKEVGKEQIAFSNIDFFLNSYTKTQFNLDELKTVCEIGIVNYQETQAVWLPPVIGESDDVYNFKLFETHPNYVTQEQVTGSIQELGKESLNLHSKIVLIESADPGFDWIFTHSISGLITSYGGQNSHMAIRCKELNIPAIIGVGEINFSLIKKSSVVYIDCLNKRFVCVG